jgi:hypothetical protein
MAENTVEAVIRMRDLASQAMLQMNKSLELLDDASKGANRGLQRVEKAATSTRGTISVLTRTTRFAAIGFISELDPAMGQVVARMTSLGAVASATGSLLKGGLIVGGITLVVGALSNWVQATNRQIEFQLQLNRTVGEFNVSGAAGQLRELVIQEEQFLAKSSTGLGPVIQFWKDLFNTLTTGRTQQEELTQTFEDTKRALDRMRVREFAGQMAELSIQIQSVAQAEAQRRMGLATTVPAIRQLGEAQIASIRAQEKSGLERLKIEEGAAIQMAVTNKRGGEELTRIAQEFGTKRALLAAQTAQKIAAAEDQVGDAVERTRERLQRQVTTMIDLQSQVRQQERVGIQRRIGESDQEGEIRRLGVLLTASVQAEQVAASQKLDIERQSLIDRRAARKIGEDEFLAGEAAIAVKRQALALQSAEGVAATEQTIRSATEQTTARREEQASRIAQLNLNLLQQQEAVIQQELGRATTRPEVSRLTEQLKANILAQEQHSLDRLAVEERLQIDLARAAKRGAEAIAAIEKEFGLQRTVLAGETAVRIREVTDQESQELVKVGQQASSALESSLSGVLEKFAMGAASFQDFWQGLWKNLVRITADASAQILVTGGQGFGAGGGAGGGILGMFSTLATSIAGLFGGGGVDYSSFQLGGTVRGGKPVAALLHPGERVLAASEAGEGMGGGVTVINLSDPEKLAGIVAQETSKGREVVVNDVIQGMRGNRGIRRGVQRFGR